MTADQLAATRPKVERVGRYPDGIRRLRIIAEIAAIGKSPTGADRRRREEARREHHSAISPTAAIATWLAHSTRQEA